MLNISCKAKTLFQYQVFKSIDSLPKEWDNYLPENHYLKTQNLELYEQAANICPYYILVENENAESIGLVYLQKNTLSLKNIGSPLLAIPGVKKLVGCVSNDFELLICGNTFTSESSGIFVKNQKFYSEIAQDLITFLNESDISFNGIIIKDLLPENTCNTSIFRPYTADFGMNLSISEAWSDISDYEISLEKKYRKRYQKIRKAFEPVDIKELNNIELNQNLGRINKLFFDVFKKQSTQIGKIKENYFENFLKYSGRKFYGYFVNDKMIGFAAYQKKTGDILDIHLVGLDYEYNNTYQTYLNLLFHGLELSINGNYKKLSLGRTALVAKASLGAIKQNFSHIYYFPNWILQRVFKYVLDGIYENQPVEIRSPFKDQ